MTGGRHCVCLASSERIDVFYGLSRPLLALRVEIRLKSFHVCYYQRISRSGKLSEEVNYFLACFRRKRVRLAIPAAGSLYLILEVRVLEILRDVSHDESRRTGLLSILGRFDTSWCVTMYP